MAETPRVMWRRFATRRWARWTGLAVLSIFAAFGAWTLIAQLRDPRRLAQQAVDNGSAQASIEHALKGQRLCGDVLDFEPFEILPAMTRTPSMRALAAAGLIERVGADEHGHFLYRMTKAAEPLVERVYYGKQSRVRLCYARPEVIGVHLEGDGSLDPDPKLFYGYRMVATAAWTRRADMQAAFPFLREAFAHDWDGPGSFYFRGRVPNLENLAFYPPTTLEFVRGFALCPPKGDDQPPGCERD